MNYKLIEKIIEESNPKYLAKNIRCFQHLENAKEVKITIVELSTSKYKVAKCVIDKKIKFTIPAQILCECAKYLEDPEKVEIFSYDISDNVDETFESDNEIIKKLQNNEIKIENDIYQYVASKKLGIKQVKKEDKTYRAISPESLLIKLSDTRLKMIVIEL